MNVYYDDYYFYYAFLKKKTKTKCKNCAEYSSKIRE